MPRRPSSWTPDDDDGAAAVEFAIVFPVAVLFLLVIVEVMMMLWVDAAMESAVRMASRFGMTGYAPGGVSREERILAIVTDRTMGFVNPSTATVTTRIYDSFDKIGVSEPYDDIAPANGRYDAGEAFVDINGNGAWDRDLGRPGIGGPGEIVVYTATYRLPFFTPLQAFIGGANGTLLQASAVIRNEPFPVAGG